MKQIEERDLWTPLSETNAGAGRINAGAGRSAPLRRGQFTFYASFYEAVDRLPKSRQLEVYRAIAQYGLYGLEPALNGSAEGVFSVIRAVLESGRSKAEAKRRASEN